jgi:hypothetical protein
MSYRTLNRISKIGRQINYEKKTQSTPDVFELNGSYFVGRIEEARLRYICENEEIQKRYHFGDWVRLKYYNLKKPRAAIKQDIVDIASKTCAPSDITRILFLLEKL